MSIQQEPSRRQEDGAQQEGARLSHLSVQWLPPHSPLASLWPVKQKGGEQDEQQGTLAGHSSNAPLCMSIFLSQRPSMKGHVEPCA